MQIGRSDKKINFIGIKNIFNIISKILIKRFDNAARVIDIMTGKFRKCTNDIF